MREVTLKCSIKKLQTAKDGGWVMSLDIPESETPHVTKLTEMREKVLQAGFVDIDSGLERDGSH